MQKPLVTVWSIIGALVTAVLLFLLYSALVRNIFTAESEVGVPTAIMHIVVVETPTRLVPTLEPGMPTPTATLDPVKYNGMGIEKYVQITGTEGDGLRLRNAPGVSSSPLFLGLEAEVFQIVNGPEEADGMVWWLLVSPTDENRKGWASASYLALLPSTP